MGVEDKAKNKAQELKGRAKQQAGEATGDEDLQAEGQADQAKGSLKNAGEKVKDAFRPSAGQRAHRNCRTGPASPSRRGAGPSLVTIRLGRRQR